MGNLGDEYIELCGGGRWFWLFVVYFISFFFMIYDFDDKEFMLGRVWIVLDMVMVLKVYLFKGMCE